MRRDVIIVGGRVAGATLAMLLARAGLDVLVIDQARFPSDTLSTHQLQLPGVARLQRWGLLDRVLAAGTPLIHRVRFHNGDVALDGCYPCVDGVDAMVSPRRTVLDTLLVDAAREAGAEVREATTLEELLEVDGTVSGVRCRAKSSGAVTSEHAALVVGADGRHSTVARLVGARAYRTQPSRTMAAYTYWDGLSLDGGEMHAGRGCVVGAWPTNDGLVMTYTGRPAADFDTFRRDSDANLLATLDTAGTLGERARAARRVGPVRATDDLVSGFRRPYGPGWALVGDAGLVMDPITGLGMGHALRDADLAAAAITAGLGGARPIAAALRDYAAVRDRDAKPMYAFTNDIASLRPSSRATNDLFEAVATSPADVSAFLATLAGARPVDEFFSPRNLARLVGVRGLLRLAADRAIRR